MAIKINGSEAVLLRIYTVIMIVAVLCALAVAQHIFVPLALASLLTFVLAPLVTRLERVTGRIASVVLVIVSVTAMVLLVGYVLSQQLVDLATKLPDYHHAIQRKVTTFQESTGGQYDRLSRAIEAVRQDLPGANRLPPVVDGRADGAGPVTVVVDNSNAGGDVQSVIGLILGGFGLAALVLLLTVFMLLYREDIRGRILRLVGNGRISQTTNAMTETGTRVFRYLLMQLCLNCGFGLAVAIGLYAIGVPNPALWGALAATLRFIPYVGPWIAAGFPILIALAVSDGWTTVLLTVGLFVTLELITNNVLEPWLYRTSTGVSSIALIFASVFWAWLWGPIGLILATPMTVCLVVIGRHIPRLSFLSVLLSDEDPLLPHQEFYHRLLRADLTEAVVMADRWRKERSLLSLYEEIYLPVLLTAESDHGMAELDHERRAALHQGVRDLLDDQALRSAASAPAQAQGSGEGGEEADHRARANVLCLPVRAMRDELAAVMLSQALDEAGNDARDLSASLTTSELVEGAALAQPALICVTVVLPSAGVQARTLCTRLRARLPTVPLIVCFIGHGSDNTDLQRSFAGLSDVTVATTLTQAVHAVTGLLQPVASDSDPGTLAAS
ncbi:MAG: AI-2E family transporter [Planctomycetes bacterium]|nr:AI-2E family transporter [Planctomycetota bacterium]